MDLDDQYESLPPTSTATTHMLAGAAAGIMEHCVFYPVDCVKTRMQSLVPDPKADYRSIPDAFRKIILHEGLKNTVRGIGAVVGGAGPAHALYFASYEHTKKVLSKATNQDINSDSRIHGLAGIVATVLHDGVMVPADVVKQRMQMYGSPYKHSLDCARTIFHHEGIRAFYRSYTTQLTMNIPFQCIHFIMYEKMQDFLNPQREYNWMVHVSAGGLAGATAAMVTMPLDVCKTLLNTQETCAKTNVSYISGMFTAFRTIYEYQGVYGYFRGLQARVVFQMPATAVSWLVYESFKFMLSKRQEASSSDSYPKISKMSDMNLDVSQSSITATVTAATE